MFYNKYKEIEWPEEVLEVFNPHLHDAVIESISYKRETSKLCLDISFYEDHIELLFEDVERVSWDIERYNDSIIEAHLYEDNGFIVASFEAACLDVVSKKMTITVNGYSDMTISF